MSVDAVKAFQNSTSIISNNSQQPKSIRECSQCDKGHLQKSSSKYHTLWWKVECFSLKIGKKEKKSTLTTLIQYHTGCPRQYNEARKRNLKSLQIGKQETKLLLFLDLMIVHVENPKKSTENI